MPGDQTEVSREVLSMIAGGLLGAALFLSISRRKLVPALLAAALIIVGTFFIS